MRLTPCCKSSFTVGERNQDHTSERVAWVVMCVAIGSLCICLIQGLKVFYAMNCGDHSTVHYTRVVYYMSQVVQVMC